MPAFASLFKHLKNLPTVRAGSLPSPSVKTYADALNGKLKLKSMDDAIKQGADGKWKLLGKNVSELASPAALDDFVQGLKKSGKQADADAIEGGLKSTPDVFPDDAPKLQKAADDLPTSKSNAKKFAKDVDGNEITAATPVTKISPKTKAFITSVGAKVGLGAVGIAAAIVGLKAYAAAKSGCYLVNSEDDARTKITDETDVERCKCSALGAQVDMGGKCGTASGCSSSSACGTPGAAATATAGAIPANDIMCYCGAAVTKVGLTVNDVSWTDVVCDIAAAIGMIITTAGDVLHAGVSAVAWLATYWWVILLVILGLIGVGGGVSYYLKTRKAAPQPGIRGGARRLRLLLQ